MNNWLKSTIGISGAGLFALVALHGAKVAEALHGFSLFLFKLVEDAPLGVSSFALAVALAVATQPFLRKWLPVMPCRQSREFVIESAALAVGFGVMFGQMPTLLGALLGVLAGLLSPYLQKGVAAVVGLIARAAQTPKAGDA